jgi:hypothetical protein
VPANYVVVGYGSSISCPGFSGTGSNTMTIQYQANLGDGGGGDDGGGGGGDPRDILPPP